MERIKMVFTPKKIVVIFLLIVLVTLVIVYRNGRKGSTQTTINPNQETPIEVGSVQTVSLPQISLSEDARGIPIRFSMATKPNFPVNINVYKKEGTPYTREQVIAIARKAGITTQPFEADDAISGKMYIFTPANATLLVYPDQHTIDLKPGGDPSGPIAGTFDAFNAEKIARKYLMGLGLVLSESDLVLDAKDITVDETDEVGGVGQGNAISFRFSYTLDGYKIVSESYNLGTALVQMNSKNEIVRAYVQEKPVVTVYGKYPLLGYTDILRVASAKAIVQTIDDSTIGGLDVNARTVKEVVVNTIELAYLSQTYAKNTLLQPIFHLKGVATLATGKLVDVALYLPALKEGVYEVTP